VFLSRSFRVAIFLNLLAPSIHSQTAPPTADSDRIRIKLNTDEAEAVLAILDKRAAGTIVSDADWQRVFTSEPYIRLKKREAAMHRDFSDEDFKKFVLTPELATRTPALRQTLDAWKSHRPRRLRAPRPGLSARTGFHQGESIPRDQAENEQFCVRDHE